MKRPHCNSSVRPLSSFFLSPFDSEPLTHIQYSTQLVGSLQVSIAFSHAYRIGGVTIEHVIE
jgi:hypothetical protein